jgi:hypothetical protein
MDLARGRYRHIRRSALWLGVGITAFTAGAGAVATYRSLTSTTSTPPPLVDSRTVENLHVAVSTVATPAASGRVSWAATWTLCWDPMPGAIGYDVQAMTSESASPRLKRVEAPCFSVELAAGEDLPADLPGKRDVQLSMQRSQLAYRVRADFGRNVVGSWSQAIDAGAPGVR